MGLGDLGREFEDAADGAWIPRVEALSVRMKGRPKGEVLAALRGVSIPGIIGGPAVLDEWATLIADGNTLDIS